MLLALLFALLSSGMAQTTNLSGVGDGANTSTTSGTSPMWSCTDSCSNDTDGICDDGGSGSEFALCGYGTDCTDCGARSPGLAPTGDFVSMLASSILLALWVFDGCKLSILKEEQKAKLSARFAMWILQQQPQSQCDGFTRR